MSTIRYYLDPVEGVSLTFERKTPGASGFDLQANIGIERVISPGQRFVFRSGLHLEMPVGIEAQVRPRSGLMRDHGILATLGTIDSDYRGNVGVMLINLGSEAYTVLPGDRIAQLVFAPVVAPHDHAPHGFWPEVVRAAFLADLGDTSRGTSGFGSTGR